MTKIHNKIRLTLYINYLLNSFNVTTDDQRNLLSELRAHPNETEWLEFKVNNASEIGEYISALANAAYIHDKEFGYIVFGIDDAVSFPKNRTV